MTSGKMQSVVMGWETQQGTTDEQVYSCSDDIAPQYFYGDSFANTFASTASRYKNLI